MKEGWGISNPGDPVTEQVNILRLNLYVPQILILWRFYTEHTYTHFHARYTHGSRHTQEHTQSFISY